MMVVRHLPSILGLHWWKMNCPESVRSCELKLEAGLWIGTFCLPMIFVRNHYLV